MWLLRPAAVVLVAVLPAVTAADASAAFTQMQTVTALSTVDSASTKSATVSCPPGMRVVGAGGSGLVVTAIRPSANLSSVTVRAREGINGYNFVWQVSAWAVCAPPPGGLERIAVTSASNSANKSAVAQCPSGKRLLGVGGEVSGSRVVLDALHPDQPLTQATAGAAEDERGTGAAWAVTAYAICSNPVSGLQRVPTGSAVDSASPKVVVSPCPVGKVPIGTGASLSAPAGQVALTLLRPESNRAVAAASEDDTGTEADWRITGYVICAARALLVSSGATPPSSSIPWRAQATAACPAGMPEMSYGASITAGTGGVWLRTLRAEDLGFAEVVATEISGTDPATWSLTAYAVCVSAIPGAFAATAAGPHDSTDAKSATVTCPAGTRVTGAGGEGALVDEAGDEVYWAPQAIRPDAALTSVTVDARDAPGKAGDPAWHPQAWAVCAPPPRGLQRVAATAPATTDGELAAVSARCPAGKHVVGVGGEIIGGEDQVGLEDLLPDAALTRAGVVATRREDSSVVDWSARAYAICVDR